MLSIVHPSSCPAERAYVLDVIFREFLGIEFHAKTGDVTDWVISLHADPSRQSLVMPDDFFRRASGAWLTPDSLPRRPLPVRDAGGFMPPGVLIDRWLPVIYGDRGTRGSRPLLEETAAGIELDIDVPGSAFFFLSRYEEAIETDRDELDRFPPSASLASREGFAARPIIDEYVEVLWHAMTRLWPALSRRPRQYTYALTHDVDLPWVVARRTPREIIRSLGADVILRRDAGLLVRRIGAAVKRGESALDADPANTFDWIMSTSERLQTVSEFNFICGHTHPEDGNYSMEDPWIQRLLVTIHRRGHLIGLHPSRGTYRDRDQLAGEFATLLRTCDALAIRQDCWGGRQHCLMWDTPVTWRNWDAVGLDYDNSMTYSTDVGFRCGVCREYPVFDVGARSRLRLRERPLILMEATLLANMRVSHAAALEWTERLADACKRYGGKFSLLWHNNGLAGWRERRLYLDMLSVIGSV